MGERAELPISSKVNAFTKMDEEERLDWAIGELTLAIGRGKFRGVLKTVLRAFNYTGFKEGYRKAAIDQPVKEAVRIDGILKQQANFYANFALSHECQDPTICRCAQVIGRAIMQTPWDEKTGIKFVIGHEIEQWTRPEGQNEPAEGL
jgi:hypothetical protein